MSLLEDVCQRIACRAHVWEEDAAYGFMRNDRVWALQKTKQGAFEWFAGKVRRQLHCSTRFVDCRCIHAV